VVDVSDDGPGIPEQNKAQVFEMFFTGQNQIADSHRSLGLGLALCRTILAAMPTMSGRSDVKISMKRSRKSKNCWMTDGGNL
jgi:K+-sensing histidine kinase KdpD